MQLPIRLRSPELTDQLSEMVLFIGRADTDPAVT